MTEPARFPDWIQPMAATLTGDRFTGDGWSFERKYDGIRLLAFKDGDTVRLFSRARNEQHIPRLSDAIAALPARQLILDGELTWDRSGAYHVFDIIWRDGRDLTALTLGERMAELKSLPLSDPLFRVEQLSHPQPWDHARREGWEGVIAKRLDSPYEPRRSKHWLKMKCELEQDFVVGGFTDPQGKRTGFGALLVGYHDAEDFVFAGRVGTGLDTALLTSLRERLDSITIDRAPFTRATGLPRLRMHWVRPEIVVRVGFIEWTAHGKLRHSRLLAVANGVDHRTVSRVT